MILYDNLNNIIGTVSGLLKALFNLYSVVNGPVLDNITHEIIIISNTRGGRHKPRRSACMLVEEESFFRFKLRQPPPPLRKI